MTLTPRLARMLALMLLAVALAVGALAVIRPIALVLDRGEEVARLRRTLAQYTARAAERPGIEARLGRLRAGGGVDDRLFNTATAGQADAALQHLTTTLIGRSGGRLDSLQVLPGKVEGPFTRIGQRMTLTTRIDGLRRLLYELEANRPMLFTDNLQVMIGVGTGFAPSSMPVATLPAATGDKEANLAVSLDVYGYTAAEFRSEMSRASAAGDLSGAKAAFPAPASGPVRP